ncbi:energy transducer TonB [Paeniroseomonas aquatica]|uniref:Energy transducer TonB n=1 Tax=Paeniroseomonas aquatica TaxID=373043 RepID=A0ABT8AEU6_9PROT|nr:energy transducer TonB [Paeniroseomonas aquatica]MDN3568299.1 energy transducer TonB [Paeniroseomonas aquatica]
MANARHLAWAASAVVHLAAGAAVLTAVTEPAAAPQPVMLLEMPMPVTPEAPPVPEPVAEPATAPAEVAPPEPPPPEVPPEQPPPPVAEAMPEPPPPQEQPPPVEPPPPPEELAALPLPPPPPPPPRPAPRVPVAPHRPPVPRPPLPQAAEAPAPTPTPAAPAAPAAPARVSGAPSPSYTALLLRALERHRRYPEDARWRRAEGVAVLRFRMARDGTVVGYRIERSTGDNSLDQAVQTMIQNASPLPPPPDELAGNPVELTVPVRFTLR